MANLVTLARLVLLFGLVVAAYRLPPAWQAANAALILVIMLLDAVDGYIARARGEETLFGAVFDIAVDRVVENVVWIVFAHLGLVPVWVAIVFVARGSVVDSVRAVAVNRGETPFGMMRSRLGRFLVVGRLMRGSYNGVKAAAFTGIFLARAGPALAPELWVEWQAAIGTVMVALVHAAVAMCLLRGLPVIVEFAVVRRDLFMPRLAHEAAE